jgi:hypothetical protein
MTPFTAFGTVFKTVFQEFNCLDFVFTNADIYKIESTGDFYAKHSIGLESLPEPISKLCIVRVYLDFIINNRRPSLGLKIGRSRAWVSKAKVACAHFTNIC